MIRVDVELLQFGQAAQQQEQAVDPTQQANPANEKIPHMILGQKSTSCS